MISVVFALEFEGAKLRATMHPRMCVSVWTLGVMGERSGSALEKLIAGRRPSIIVSAGFSGALRAEVPAGTIVVGENFTDFDAVRGISFPEEFRFGRIATCDEILLGRTSKLAFAEETGALAADMESAHLHAVCKHAGIPMLSLRAIADTLDQNIPVPGNVLMDPETGRANPQGIFKYLFAHPKAAPEFARLVRNARAAQHALARGINAILPILLMRGPGFK